MWFFATGTSDLNVLSLKLENHINEVKVDGLYLPIYCSVNHLS